MNYEFTRVLKTAAISLLLPPGKGDVKFPRGRKSAQDNEVCSLGVGGGEENRVGGGKAEL